MNSFGPTFFNTAISFKTMKSILLPTGTTDVIGTEKATATAFGTPGSLILYPEGANIVQKYSSQ